MKRIEKISEKRRLTERGRVTYSSFTDFYNAIIEKDPRVTETLFNWEFNEKYTVLIFRGKGYKVTIDLNKGRSFYVVAPGVFVSLEMGDVKGIFTDNDVIGVTIANGRFMTFGGSN